MTDLTEKVISVLRENGIDEAHTLEALTSIYSELEYSMWHDIKVNAGVFYGLKDVIWYNLEHLPSGGEEKGISDLRFIGTKFPHFIYSFNEGDTIKNEDIPDFLNDISIITSKWDKSWLMANIYTNAPIGYQGGENPSKIVIHARGESPARYTGTSHVNRTSKILGPNGSQLRTKAEEYVYCVLDDEIGEYCQGPILYGVLMKLREAAQSAYQYGKSLRLELET